MLKNVRFWLSISDDRQENVVNMDRSRRGGLDIIVAFNSVQLEKKIALIHQVDYKSFGNF